MEAEAEAEVEAALKSTASTSLIDTNPFLFEKKFALVRIKGGGWP